MDNLSKKRLIYFNFKATNKMASIGLQYSFFFFFLTKLQYSLNTKFALQEKNTKNRTKCVPNRILQSR